MLGSGLRRQDFEGERSRTTLYILRAFSKRASARALDYRTNDYDIRQLADLCRRFKFYSVTMKKVRPDGQTFFMVAGVGLEPTTSWL